MEFTNSRDLRDLDTLPRELTIVDADGRKCTVNSVSRFLPGQRLSGPGLLDNEPVFFKFFFAKSKATDEALHESETADALSRAGVSTPTLLGRGEIPGGGAWLALTLIPECRTFKEVWEQHTEHSIRTRLYKDLLGLHADLYKAGYDQTDPHRENYVYRDNRIFAIDLGTVRPLDASNDAGVRRSLTLLLAQFPTTAWDDMRSIAMNLDLPSVDLSKVATAWRRRIRRVADKSLRPTSRNSVVNTPNARIVCRRDFDHGRWHGLMRNIDDLDRVMNGGESLKEGNSATVARVKIDGLDCVIKRYNIKNRRVWLKRMLGKSRARNSWWAAHLLEAMGILTPQPLALVERRGVCPQAYLINRAVVGKDAAAVFAKRPFSNRESAEFDAFFEAMKNACMSHGDCKATNFILKDGLVYVIDLDGVRLHHSDATARIYRKKDQDRFDRNWRD